MLRSGAFDVCYAPDSGVKADIAGGSSCAKTGRSLLLGLLAHVVGEAGALPPSSPPFGFGFGSVPPRPIRAVALARGPAALAAMQAAYGLAAHRRRPAGP